MAVFLGLDTSNYTTSCALYDSESRTVRQQKQLLPVRSGEKGLRQSDAVFHHTVQLPALLEKLELPPSIAGIGVSVRPRNAEGSYMPCFLVGEGTARALGAALHVPIKRQRRCLDAGARLRGEVGDLVAYHGKTLVAE